jgi:putative bacteriocin precursor
MKKLGKKTNQTSQTIEAYYKPTCSQVCAMYCPGNPTAQYYASFQAYIGLGG